MALTPGTRLGVYEVTEQIGAGGMGEVYRATDGNLKRSVAIKVLPASVAGDADRLARFQREAEVLAALNHPNIGAIYGLEKTPDFTALVMELVEGEDLSQRIARGPIPLDEALAIAKQIADALEAAHEQGIIHRDLKPANIKVRPDGTVKVLDFGLAKAMDPAGGSSANAMNSPTLSIHATQAGIILGTAAYMSPEQASAKPVDKRADVWSFGVVVMEMLTGQRLFDGETISHTLADVLRGPIDFNRLPARTPRAIRDLLRRCLNRDVKKRLRDMGEARIAIEEALSGSALEETPSAALPALAAPPSVVARAVPWASTAALAAGLAAVLVLWAPWRPPTTQPGARVSMSAELGADVPLMNGTLGPDAILSPDGTVLVFVGGMREGRHGLYTRRLDQLKARTLSGTDGAESPFFAPDGQWIAFFAGGKLKKVPTAGGAVIPLCDAPSPRGGAWSEDGTIVFQPDTRSVPNAPLMRISADGGTPQPLTPLIDGEVTQRWPEVLPGGRAVLYTSSRVIGAFDDANLVVLERSTGARRIVQRGGYHGRYLRSGHLVYIHDGSLFAAPFDLGRFEVTGQPVAVLNGIVSNTLSASAQFAASSDGGMAVYIPGQSNGSSAPIHWMDRAGRTTLLRAPAANWSNIRFSPDGRRLAVEILDGQNDIWVYEWARDILTPLTSDPASDTSPVWTPDGRRIVFASTRANSAASNLYWQRADGTGEAQRLTESKKRQRPVSWHLDGKLLAFEEFDEQGRSEVMILPMTGDDQSGWKPGTPRRFLAAQASATEPTFSPDGRWLAYTSDETGRDEVYVRPFPGPGAKLQVSTTGGEFPTWSRTRHELIYGNGVGNQIMVVSFATPGDGFQVETPRMWPEGRFEQRGPWRMFDLHPDGERLGLRPGTGSAPQTHVTFVFNFFDELRRTALAVKR